MTITGCGQTLEGIMQRLSRFLVLATALVTAGAVAAQAMRPLSPGSANVAGPVALVRGGMGGMPTGGMGTGGMGGMATGGMGGMATGGMGGMAAGSMGGMAMGGMGANMAGPAGTLGYNPDYSHARRERGKNDASVSIWQQAARLLGLGHDKSGGGTRTAQYVGHAQAR